jgi:hypothetical protein
MDQQTKLHRIIIASAVRACVRRRRLERGCGALHLKHAAVVEVSQLFDGDAWECRVTMRTADRDGGGAGEKGKCMRWLGVDRGARGDVCDALPRELAHLKRNFAGMRGGGLREAEPPPLLGGGVARVDRGGGGGAARPNLDRLSLGGCWTDIARCELDVKSG